MIVSGNLNLFQGLWCRLWCLLGTLAMPWWLSLVQPCPWMGRLVLGLSLPFMAYVRIFSQPLSQIAQGITSLQQASAAMGRVFEFLAEKEMEDESHKERQLSDMKRSSSLWSSLLWLHTRSNYYPWLFCDRSCRSKGLPLSDRQELVRQPLSIFWWSSNENW